MKQAVGLVTNVVAYADGRSYVQLQGDSMQREWFWLAPDSLSVAVANQRSLVTYDCKTGRVLPYRAAQRDARKKEGSP